MSGSEPADAIRAVNALLTRLDQLKAAPNVMVGWEEGVCECVCLSGMCASVCFGLRCCRQEGRLLSRQPHVTNDLPANACALPSFLPACRPAPLPFILPRF